MKNIIPEIGMGVTINYYSDRSPGTIIQVLRKKIVIQIDNSVRVDNNGMSECQVYTYSSDANGTMLIASLRKDGTYRLSKSKTLVSLGIRQKYYDYSF